jgi:hypothetical protein
LTWDWGPLDDPIAVESLYGQRVAAEILGDLRVARGLARLLYVS